MTIIIPPTNVGGQDLVPTSLPVSNLALAGLLDSREQLCNEGRCGPITTVQLPAERITKLRGILFDVDPKLIRQSSVNPRIPGSPKEFYDVVVKPWLRRHPVLVKAEVRCSGTGIHVILWFADPPEFESDEDRKRWEGIVLVVQRALPVDPDQPGITAVTRPIGSVNSKNGAQVVQLVPPTPVSFEEILSLFDQMRKAPFRTVANILFGTDKIAPCPKCGQAGTHLSALDRAGHCYGSCGKVTLADLYDLMLVPRSDESQTGGNHGTE